jgi:hypothetical protein
MREEGSHNIPGATDRAEPALKAEVELSAAGILQCIFCFFKWGYCFHNDPSLLG